MVRAPAFSAVPGPLISGDIDMVENANDILATMPSSGREPLKERWKPARATRWTGIRIMKTECRKTDGSSGKLEELGVCGRGRSLR
jgi:hypothetical protein